MSKRKSLNRRDFLRDSGAASLIGLAVRKPGFPAGELFEKGRNDFAATTPTAASNGTGADSGRGERINLSPASWIWFPSERTLPNSFILFRRELHLASVPLAARGWITADSRYRLTLNGNRIQWGPGPCDPRWVDVDPLDLTPHLRPGLNVIGVEVLHFGFGEATWVTGKPGFLFSLAIDLGAGRVEKVVSDEVWQACLDRAHRPGQYKRWHMRALQEEFDARLHPQGWDTAGFVPDRQWLPAMKLDSPADKPAICGTYFDYLEGKSVLNISEYFLRRRDIPLMREFKVPAMRLAESGHIEWLRDPLDWFEFRTPNSFRVRRDPVALSQADGKWQLPATSDSSVGMFATFEFKEEITGFPYFEIDAPQGTVVEMISQEAHELSGTTSLDTSDRNPSGSPENPLRGSSQRAWLDTSWYCWSRWTCREGINRFEAFDYEGVRWLQLHVRNASRPVTIRAIGVRRRVYDWAHEPRIHCSEPALQRLFDACINSLQDGIQDNVVCDAVRERAQYCAQAGQVMQSVRYAFGERRLPERYLRTFSEGITPSGYFVDPWPASDGLARIGQRVIGASEWPAGILDEDLLFIFDCLDHYIHTGSLETIGEPYPRLLRFAKFVEQLRGTEELLPAVETPELTVWLDDYFHKQKLRTRQCGLNLIAAASFQYGLAPLARAFGDLSNAERFVKFGKEIEAATVRRFWSADLGMFVDNFPWVKEDGSPILYDKTLAISILYDQCPGQDFKKALWALVETPPGMLLAYTYESYWRYRALAKLGRMDVVLKDFRSKWANLNSVRLNNTLPEYWGVKPDSMDEWNLTYAGVPLYMLFMDIAGIVPTEPGFARCQVRPQLADLGSLELTAHTVRGPIQFVAESVGSGHRVVLDLPQRCEGELLLPPGVPCGLERLAPDHPLGLRRFRLKAGETASFSTRG